MKIKILTLFPDIVNSYFSNSIMSRAVEKKLIEYQIIDIKEFGVGQYKKCDDYPYGGGPGMVLKPEPIIAGLKTVLEKKSRVIYPSPSGKKFDHKYAVDLSKSEDLIFICGRYEGLDQRVIDKYVDDEISIGDYVISSGEIASLVIIDGFYRHIEGVISGASLLEESFSDDENLLEYPQYTKPEIFDDMAVPDILLSGHHKNIEKWRYEKRVEKTLKNRPELLQKK